MRFTKEEAGFKKVLPFDPQRFIRIVDVISEVHYVLLRRSRRFELYLFQCSLLSKIVKKTRYIRIIDVIWEVILRFIGRRKFRRIIRINSVHEKMSF